MARQGRTWPILAPMWLYLRILRRWCVVCWSSKRLKCYICTSCQLYYAIACPEGVVPLIWSSQHSVRGYDS